MYEVRDLLLLVICFFLSVASRWFLWVFLEEYPPRSLSSLKIRLMSLLATGCLIYGGVVVRLSLFSLGL